MKSVLLSLFILISVHTSLLAATIDATTAQTVARNMLQQIYPQKQPLDLQLVHTDYYTPDQGVTQMQAETLPLCYVFDAGNNQGFIFIAGDDRSEPILGYTSVGNYHADSLPYNFRKWMEGYKNQLRYIISNQISATAEIADTWQKLITGNEIQATKNSTAVGPLLTTTWNQSPYVNALCPYDYNYNELTVTGCPATAMAQIMKYWNYPEHGTGFHSYNDPNYGTLSANFASTTYNWSTMPNNVNASNTAVATLMYHCGVAVDMMYGVAETGGSGSYVIINSPQPEGNSEYAYKTYFGYNPSTIQGLKRENFTDNVWTQKIKTELDAGRPVQYAGFGAGGHTFVCDGYDNNYFHMNWGWGGYADGFFLLNALNPGSGGTGSGAGTYNNGQQAVIGIQPLQQSSSNYDIALYANVTPNPQTLTYGQSFTVHTDVANFGTGSFNGDFCAALFDENYNFVDYVAVLTGYTLGSNQHYTNGLDFANAGTVTFLPGSYFIGIYYRPTGGDWVMAGDANFSNLVPYEIKYSNDIELYADMVLSTGTTITQNAPLTVTLAFLNNGSSTFTGDVDVSLYTLDGNFAETIQTLNGANLSPGYYYDNVQFTTNSVNIEPGTYLMALLHKPTNSDWELSGSTWHSNPVFVTIQQSAALSDSYENNNSEETAYNLPINFSGNAATTSTTGSNAHQSTDEDFYKIVLPQGYNYSITARIHDSYSSSNGQTYTCDMAWLYNSGSGWSDIYDDVLPGPIAVTNGGTVHFRVAPYFTGQTGSYLLEIKVTRTPASAISDEQVESALKLYPNPANNWVNIETENQEIIRRIVINDLTGRQVKLIAAPDSKTNSIDISSLETGNYQVIIQSDKHIWKRKLIIAHTEL